jgi:acetyl-CoA carboxylase biotin carboxyl carrier protein
MSDTNDSQLPDLSYVRQLAKVFRRYDLGELEIEAGGQRILLRKQDLAATVAMPASAPVHYASAQPASAAAPVQPAGESPSAKIESGEFIACPFVGTFFRASSPTAEPFVKVGDTVQPGQTICIVEAMKLFNEIEAEFACVIEEVLKESGQPVEFGTNLFRVRRL